MIIGSVIILVAGIVYTVLDFKLCLDYTEKQEEAAIHGRAPAYIANTITDNATKEDVATEEAPADETVTEDAPQEDIVAEETITEEPVAEEVVETSEPELTEVEK